MATDSSDVLDEEWDAFAAEREQAAANSPDLLDRMREISDMITIVAAQRLLCVDALRSDFLADATRHGAPLTDILERSVRLEIASALRITEYAAGELLFLSDALVHRYPAALDSLSSARMTERRAAILVAGVDEVERDLRGDVLPRAIALAESLPVGRFRRALRALIEEVRIVTLAEHHARALEDRRIAVEDVDAGMAWLHLYGPAVEVHAIHDRVTRMGKAISADDPEDQRTLDQLRADVVCDLLIDGTTSGHPGAASGIRATVVVTVPALSLLAETDAELPRGAHAVVEGLGPIPIATARELCGGADGWMRVLTRPETGMVLSVGRDQYRPPAALRRLVRWRADRCMAPGCDMPASRCEVDHSLAWGARRRHLVPEPRAALQGSSHRQAPRQMDRSAARRNRRRTRVDLADGPPLPRASRAAGSRVHAGATRRTCRPVLMQCQARASVLPRPLP